LSRAHAGHRSGLATVVAWMWCAGAGVALLPACTSVELGDPPADVNACRPSQNFFANGGPEGAIWADFLDKTYSGRKCADATCHDSSVGRSLSLKIPEPFPPGGVPIPLPPIWAANYRSVTENMQCASVTSSPLLRNPSGQVTHGGNKLIEPDGPEAKLVIEWVTAP
jgi:hypothetical protein